MKFEEYLDKIEKLEIQGAEQIAKASMYALISLIEENKDLNKEELINVLKKGRDLLLSTRPTEPAMKNALDYVFYNVNYKNVNNVELVKNFIERINHVLKHFEECDEIISNMGEKLIKNGYIVYTHCHSSTVMKVLKKAKDRNKRFKVYVTETRPHYQGRRTAIELNNYGIKVKYFVDSAARIALKEADIMLIGADAITADGKVINKIGSEMFAIIANKYDVPVYVCTNSWKFDPKSIFGYEIPIEEGKRNVFWEDGPKEIEIYDYLFEKIDPKYIRAIISELGIFPPEIFAEELKRNYIWMFKKI